MHSLWPLLPKWHFTTVGSDHLGWGRTAQLNSKLCEPMAVDVSSWHFSDLTRCPSGVRNTHRSGRRPTTLNLWVHAPVGQGRPAPPQRRTWLSRDCPESVALPPDGAFFDVIGTTRFDFRESSFVLSRQRFFSKKAIACPSRHRRKQATASGAEIINNANKRNSVVAKPNRRRHSTSETMPFNAPFRLEVFRF
jgi:hypothetical protein